MEPWWATLVPYVDAFCDEQGRVDLGHLKVAHLKGPYLLLMFGSSLSTLTCRERVKGENNLRN